MYLECQLVFKNYKPLKLEKGMFFITEVMGINLIKQLEQVPFNQEEFGTVVKKEDQEQLLQPTKTFELPNIHAVVEHFICVQLPTFKSEIIQVTIQENAYYRSLKHYLKKLLKKQTQPYISIKEVNDLLLTEILYRYKHHNYAYEISDDLKTITFTIKL